MIWIERLVRNDITCLIAAILLTLMLISAAVMWLRTLSDCEELSDFVSTFISGGIVIFVLVALTYTLWAEYFR